MCLNSILRKLYVSNIKLFLVVGRNGSYSYTLIHISKDKLLDLIKESNDYEITNNEIKDLHEELFCNYTEFGLTLFRSVGETKLANTTLMMSSEKYIELLHKVNETV